MSSKFKSIAILGAIGLLALQASAADVKLDTNTQKLSYTIGYEMGNNFRKQQVQLDADVVLKGLQDGLADNKALLDQQTREATILAFQKEVVAKEETNFKEQTESNKQEAKNFFQANAKKEGIKILPDGMQYKIIKEGSGQKPSADDTVTVNYEGRFIDGKVFDSSYQRGKPATFALKQVIQGWQDALVHMPTGSTWEVYVPSTFAYGERGMGSAIGPNKALVFKIELISIAKK